MPEERLPPDLLRSYLKAVIVAAEFFFAAFVLGLFLLGSIAADGPLVELIIVGATVTLFGDGILKVYEKARL